MPAAEFERKLADRLKEEIKVNKQKLDEDFKRELKDEKRRILAQSVRLYVCNSIQAKEKEELKNENKQLMYEIQKLKVMLKTGPINNP